VQVRGAVWGFWPFSFLVEFRQVGNQWAIFVHLFDGLRYKMC